MDLSYSSNMCLQLKLRTLLFYLKLNNLCAGPLGGAASNQIFTISRLSSWKLDIIYVSWYLTNKRRYTEYTVIVLSELC